MNSPTKNYEVGDTAWVPSHVFGEKVHKCTIVSKVSDELYYVKHEVQLLAQGSNLSLCHAGLLFENEIQAAVKDVEFYTKKLKDASDGVLLAILLDARIPASHGVVERKIIQGADGKFR